METKSAGALPDGREVQSFILTNGQGMTATILEYGCILQSLEVPDRTGTLADVTLGHESLEDWLENPGYFNAVIGRFGGRIDNGQLRIGDQSYSLPLNHFTEAGNSHIHGGVQGLSKRLWSGEPIAGREAVRLTYHSPDGEEGYPGNLTVTATYELRDDNSLVLTMEGETDAPTVLNMASHTYWNLSGDPSTTILDHELSLKAPHLLEAGEAIVPTGRILDVEATPFDFRAATRVGERIGDDDEQLQRGGGYDHYWIFDPGSGVRHIATVKDPKSGRILELETNQPGVVCYTGNHLGEAGRFKKNARYQPHSGLCLETQGYPDAPNHEHFPSCVLYPGEQYRHVMVHRFRTEG